MIAREICGLADRRNDVHFNQVTVVQAGDRDNSAGRFMGAEEIRIYCIDLPPQSGVRDIHGRLEHAFTTATAGLQNGIDIFQNLQGLRFNAFEFPVWTPRDNGKLPGKKHETVVHNGLRIMAARLGCSHGKGSPYFCHGNLSRSTLPPVSTIPTRLPATSRLPSRIAPRGGEQEGSMMIFMISQVWRMALITFSSLASTISSTYSWISAKLLSPSRLRSPSHMVFGVANVTMIPLLNERNPSSAPAGSAPMTLIFGLMPFTATAVPDSKPPPPKGVMTMSRSGTSSSSSSAAVPCPAITR